MDRPEFMPRPDRVVVDGTGTAVSSINADRMGVYPTVIYIRDDGWSLGAADLYQEIARKLWEDQWVAVIVDGTIKPFRRH